VRNIEIFEACSALLMAELYEHFPLRIDIQPSTLALMLGDDLWDESLAQIEGTTNQFNRNRHKSPVGLSKPTIEWLMFAGLIHYESYNDGEFKKVCLTPKGFESIKAKPENESKLLKAAKDIVSSTAKDTAKKELKEAFSGILSWCTQNSPTVFQTISNMAQGAS
jgi:hypothetical protein